MDDPYEIVQQERDAARDECARLREKLERQQQHHLAAMREREETAAKVYDELLKERNQLLEDLARTRANFGEIGGKLSEALYQAQVEVDRLRGLLLATIAEIRTTSRKVAEEMGGEK